MSKCQKKIIYRLREKLVTNIWMDGCTNKHEFIEEKHLNECFQGSAIYQTPWNNYHEVELLEKQKTLEQGI